MECRQHIVKRAPQARGNWGGSHHGRACAVQFRLPLHLETAESLHFYKSPKPSACGVRGEDSRLCCAN